MNFPNLLTVLRTIMSLVTAVLLCFDPAGLPTFTFFFFVTAGATDWLDGYIARKNNIVTVFGKFMDALSDKIMVIGLFLILLGLNLYKDWQIFAMYCALICVTREFFVSGIRMLAAGTGTVLAAEKMGKYKAALQMYSIGAIICARAVELDWSGFEPLYYFAFYTGIGSLAIATVLSTWSGISYAFRYGYLLKA